MRLQPGLPVGAYPPAGRQAGTRKDSVPMPGFSRRSGGVIMATAMVLTTGAFAIVTRSGPPAYAHAQGGTTRGTAAAHQAARVVNPQAAPPAHTVDGATASGATRLQPGGPLRTGRGGAAPPASFAANGPILESTNWGGYAATHQQRSFRYAQATFFVPYVDCATTPDTYSTHWVGLDGVTTGTVEQTGVLASCRGSKAEYAAWYEMFPKLPVYPALTVHPGDSIVASVYYRASTRTFTVRLSDTTTGHGFEDSHLTCPRGSTCRRSDAEVISEAPSAGGKVLPLTDFRAASFTAVRLTDIEAHRGGLRARWWTTAKITMVSALNTAVLDQPTSIYASRAFDNYWMGSS